MKDGEGAIEKLGKFDEGYCIKINSIQETTLVCMPTEGAFSKFFMSMWSEKGKMAASS